MTSEAIEIAEIPKQDTAIEALKPYSKEEIRRQVNRIQEILKDIMIEGEHYGKIPGCGPKPALLKPGAEKICLAFRLVARFEWTMTEHKNDHREYDMTCRLYGGNDGPLLGEGVGVCSTLESKHRYRNAAKKCPDCGKETIIKGKAEYGGGWICFAKKGGCGAKWQDGDRVIEGQDVGKVENQDPADQWNTVKKLSKKRAYVDAVLTVTAASDIFTQDIEDINPSDRNDEPTHQRDEPARKDEPSHEPEYQETIYKINNANREQLDEITNWMRANHKGIPEHSFQAIREAWALRSNLLKEQESERPVDEAEGQPPESSQAPPEKVPSPFEGFQDKIRFCIDIADEQGVIDVFNAAAADDALTDEEKKRIERMAKNACEALRKSEPAT